MTDLGWTGSTCGPRANGGAVAINERGQIVGSAGYLLEDGEMLDLGTLGGNMTCALALNDLGQVVGQSQTAGGRWRAFLWEKGVMKDLGALTEEGSSVALAINNRGQVAGQSETANGSLHAVLWENDAIIDLGTLRGRGWSEAAAINDRGQVVGTSDTQTLETLESFDHRHAFLWQEGKLIDLGTLGGTMSEARSTNERGEILGVSLAKDGTLWSVLWENGTIGRLMPDLGDKTMYAINDSGQIVGSSWTGERNEHDTLIVHAAVWENGRMTDLLTLATGRNSYAFAINEHDQIVGVSETTDGRQHGVLWQLTDE